MSSSSSSFLSSLSPSNISLALAFLGDQLSASVASNFYILITFSRPFRKRVHLINLTPFRAILVFVFLLRPATDKSTSSAASYYRILTLVFARGSARRGAAPLNHRDSNSGVITCSFFRRSRGRQSSRVINYASRFVPTSDCLPFYVQLSPYLSFSLFLFSAVFISFPFGTYSAE